MTVTGRGKVWIVGAGPGDPGLLTFAAARALAQADVVLYDALASPALLRHAPSGADLRFVGKRSGDHAVSQEDIQALMVSLAQEGKSVVRLKGGDPFVFGHGSEEALACRERGVPVVGVPGITSAFAALAYAGIPVTHRHVAENLLVITGHHADRGRDVDWEFAARADTLIVLMGVETLGNISASLIAAGKERETPAAALRWGTRPDQQVVCATLATLPDEVARAGLRAPAVIVVGHVAAFSQNLAWFATGPLAGRRVAVTRARHQSSRLSSELGALGAHVVETPAIDVSFNASGDALYDAITSHPAWVAFTSVNAVAASFEALQSRSLDARAFAQSKLAAVGGVTADALRGRGLLADFIPSKAASEALAAELPVKPGERVVLPASSQAGAAAASVLRARGADVTQIVAYTNTFEPLDDQQRREVAEADVITFTSASTACNLREALGEASVAPSTQLVSIGPKTSAALRDAFGRVDREAASPTLASLIDAVQAVLQ